MQRWLTGTTVVFIWGGLNALLAAILAGFAGTGFDGSAGRAGMFPFILYAASSSLVFLIALVAWVAQRRRRAGERLPPRPVAALLLAVAIAVAWLALPLGRWAAYLAVAPLIAAIVAEAYPRS